MGCCDSSPKFASAPGDAPGMERIDLVEPNMEGLNDIQQWEQSMPFSRIFIQTFIQKTKDLTEVTPEALRACIPSPAWEPLENEDSQVSKWIQQKCKTIDQLKCYALISCQGSKKEKAIALYNLFQDNGWGDDSHTHIAACDKDIKTNVLQIFKYAAQENIAFINQVGGQLPDGLHNNTRQLDDEMEELVDDWLDDIWGRNSRVENSQYLAKVTDKKGSWIFDPEEIRKRVYEKKEIDYY